MRLFIALNLPSELRTHIAADVLAPLRSQLPGVRWVREETLHVTLLFLGKRSEAEAQEAQTVMREVTAAHASFTTSLAGLGVFPDSARPRVVWLGLEDSASVQKLHQALMREHARLGVPLEGRAYRPHVTLGRVPPPAEAAVSKALDPALAAVRFAVPVTFGSVDLMQSELTPQGPRYTVLLAAPLAHAKTS